MRTTIILTSIALILAVGGCGGRPPAVTSTTPSAPATSSASGVQTTTPAATPTSTSSGQPATPPAPAAKHPAPVPRPSAESLAYAKRIGGTSHDGEKLYFVIGDSVGSEREAQLLLKGAAPKFGAIPAYFIVQRSDNFAGMKPGLWVVLEAHRSSPSPEDVQFDRGGFPRVHVVQATVRTADPIPVYDDLVPQ